MNQRVLGFVLVAAGILGTIFAFTTVSIYAPQRGLAYNLQNARLFRQGSSVPCPRPGGLSRDEKAPFGCPDTASEYRDAIEAGRTPRHFTIESVGVPLGYGVMVMAAVALAGVGFLIFGKKE